MIDRDEYYTLANSDCVAVAKALGMAIDNSKQTTEDAIHIRHSGGLYIFPLKNNWYRHSDGKKGFPIDLVMDRRNYRGSYDQKRCNSRRCCPSQLYVYRI